MSSSLFSQCCIAIRKISLRTSLCSGMTAALVIGLAASVQFEASGAAVADHKKGRTNYVMVDGQAQAQKQPSARIGDGGSGGLGSAKIIWIKVKHRSGGQPPIVYFETDTLLNVSTTSTPNMQKHFYFEYNNTWYNRVDSSMIFARTIDFSLVTAPNETHSIDDNAGNSINLSHYKIQNVVFVD